MGSKTGVKISGLILAAAVFALGLLAGAPPAFATHYPSGAACYDCHAITETKMIVGTRLIKSSPKTAEYLSNGWVAGQPMPCVFCHEKNAVANNLNPTTEMVAVSHLFASTSASKHGVSPVSSTADNTGGMECVDCHNRMVGLYVVSDTTGNANVHGVNAAAADYAASSSFQQGLGDTSPGTAITAIQTCSRLTCHGSATPQTVAPGRVAQPKHNYGNITSMNGTPVNRITINGVVVAGLDCFGCHDSHGSTSAPDLITLRQDGTHGNETTNSSPYVQPTDCGVCHNADDGGNASDWKMRGHGGSTYAGNKVGATSRSIGYACSTCHDATVKHDFTRVNKRFSMGVRSTLESICTNCHQTVSTHQNQAGCVNCHEPHGQGLANGTATPYNIMMVKPYMELDNNGSTLDKTVYTTSGSRDNVPPATEYGYWPNNTSTYNSSSSGVCDNYDCHSTKPTIFPLAGFITTNAHLGGPMSHTDNCASCHEHNAGWTAGTSSCSTCHGYPPSSTDFLPDNPDAVGVHKLHADTQANGGLNYGCSVCHKWNGTTIVHTKTLVPGNPVPTAAVDVVFDSAINPGATYDKATNTCNNLTCHNPDTKLNLRNASATANAPVWSSSGTYTAITTCQGAGSCHGNAGAADTHYKHEASAPNGKAYACRACHNTLDAVTNAYDGLHGDGTINSAGSEVTFDLSLVSASIPSPATGVYNYAGGKTCSAVYCHGGTAELSSAGGSDITPQWGVATTGACGTCHDTGTTDSTVGTVISSGHHTTHITTARGPVLGSTATGCNACHPAYTLTAAAHVDGKKSFQNNNTSLTTYSVLGSTAPAIPPADGSSTDRCNNCHSTASVTTTAIPGGGVGTVLAKQNWTNTLYTLDCLTCHNGTPANSKFDATGDAAPNVYGATGYGAEKTGHSRPTTANVYPVSGNPAANQVCGSCHNTAATHFVAGNQTGVAGNRINGTLNAIPVSTLDGVCNACHANTGVALNNKVNTHANTDFTNRREAVFSENCADCHDVHGMVNNGTGNNIFMIKSNVLLPGGGTTTNMRFEAVTGNYSYNDNVGSGTDDLCVVCHVGTMVYNQNGQHAGPLYGNDERGNRCTTCHPHNRDSNVATSDGLMPMDCNGCHTFPGQATVPGTHRLSAVHDKHIGRPSDEAAINNKAYKCTECHYNSDHNTSGLSDPALWVGTVTAAHVQVRFNPAFNSAAAATNQADNKVDATAYNETAHTCASTYCHGADTATFPVADQGSTVIPNWTVAASGACGTCHKATTGAPPGDSAHPTHSGTYAFGCQICHNSVTTDGLTISGTGWSTNHVNKTVEVALDQTDARIGATSAYTGDSVVGSGFGSCNNTYCHSTGADKVKPFTSTGVVLWNGSTACNSCHGAAASGIPNYADGTLVDGLPKANKHTIHATTNGQGCGVCHYPTTSTGNTITGPGVHVNGSYDAAANPANTMETFAYVQASGTCNSTNCHGGTSGVLWSGTGPINCDVCHARTGGVDAPADVNDFGWANLTQSKVAKSEYDARGHGEPTRPNKTCAACHDSSIPHDMTMTANPYRLKDLDTGTAGLQFTCSTATGCHAAGINGPATGLAINTFVSHTKANMDATSYATRYAWSFAPDCVNCHDPHGDGSNLSMIQREVYDKSAFNLPLGPVPAQPTEQLSLQFTDNTTGISAAGTSYAQGVPTFSAICQECHEGTPGTNTTKGFVDGVSANYSGHPGYVSATSDNGQGDCSNCHKHDTAFKPSGCNGCHGGDDAAWNNGNYWPSQGSVYPERGGEHSVHITKLMAKLYPARTPLTILGSEQQILCAYCHNDPTGVGGNGHYETPTYTAPANVGNFEIIWNGAADANGTYTAGNGSCQTVDCHNNKDTNTTTSNWYSGATSACAMCHTDGGATNDPTSGLHAVTPTISGMRHSSGIPGGCTACHTTLTAQTTHINGTFMGNGSIVGDRTAMGLAAFYTNGGSNDNGTCITTGGSCHATPPTTKEDDWVHKWTTPNTVYTNATGACQGCHGDQTGWNTGVLHRTSVAMINTHGSTGTYRCYDCHGLEAAAGTYVFSFGTNDWGGTSKHGNGSIEINSNGTAYNETTNLCSACHGVSDGTHNFVDTTQTIAYIAADAVTVNCGACHTGGVTPSSASGAHANHGAGIAQLLAGGVACDPCHGTIPGGYQSTIGSTHGNGTVNFSGATYSTAVRNNLTGTCTTTSCHNRTGQNGQSAAWNATALACDACHYWTAGTPAAATNNQAWTGWALTGSHNAHFDLASAVSGCNECHPDNTTDTGATLTHITGVTLAAKATPVAINAGLTAGALGTQARAGVANTQRCDNVLCHNPSNDAHLSNQWNTANAGCAMCHVDPAVANSAPPTGSHTQHRQASVTTTFGVTLTCAGTTGCHVDYTGNPTHMNKTHNITLYKNGTATPITSQLSAGPGTFATQTGCGLNDCHGNGQGRNVAAGLPNAYTWGTNTAPDKCAVCHGNGTTMTTYGHNKHLNNGYASAPCTDCHTAASAVTHLNASLNFQNLANIAGTIGVTNNVAVGTSAATPNNGTCATVNCHNRGTTIGGATASAAWNVGGNGLACDACHYYRTPPTSATNTGWSAISATHGQHFDRNKTCTQCHGALPVNTTHIGGKTTLTSGAVAALGEGGVDFTDATAVTDYSYNTTEHTCYSATNSGLGCHSSGGDLGAADPSRPDWDLAFASTNCTQYCHTNTTDVATNPTSGLHGVTPTVTGQAHNQTLDSTATAGVSGCSECHTPVAATHQNGAFTGNGSVPADRTAMGLGAFYTNGGSDNTGTCVNTGTGCHGGAGNNRDDWSHQWNSTANYYTTSPSACNGCHGVAIGSSNLGSTAGVTHRPVTAKHSGTGVYGCRDCHNIDGPAGGATGYTFTFAAGQAWQGSSSHGDGSISVNNNGVVYNETSHLCTNCHGAVDGTHDMVETNWPILYAAGLAPVTTCGECHTGGVKTGTASGSHSAHNSGSAALVAPGTVCTDCHGNNGGSNYQNALTGTHGNGSVNFSAITYSTLVRNDLTGTCVTTSCHNRGTGASQSEPWNIPAGSGTPGTNDLSCNACHYWEASPSAVNDTTYRTNGRGGLSLSHDDHFAKGKVCIKCHATVTTTAHINGITSNTDKAVAVLGEGGVDFTANLATDPDYTYNTTERSCYTPTNNGLGCHASAGSLGSGDASRPNWNNAIAATDCTTYCHSNTTSTATNPTSGLHGVTPSVTGQAHNQTMPGTGCSACHTVGALGTHINGTFTGNGTLAGDRTNMGLGTWYTNGGSDDNGTCSNTGTSCHGGANTYRDDWAHKWTTPNTAYTASPSACDGCHGDWGAWSAGVLHRTSSSMQSMHGDLIGGYNCGECHVLGDAAYSFTFGTNDWGGTSRHGNGSIEVNSNGTGPYNTTSNLCTACHSVSDSIHNFTDTSWAINLLAGPAVTASCAGCHGYPPVAPGQGGGSTPPEENYTGGGGAHKVHVDFIASKLGLALTSSTDPKQICGPCHGESAGSANHADSGRLGGAWANSDRPFVNIRDRAGSTSWAGTGATYGGSALPTTGANALLNATNSRCVNADCHGTTATDTGVVVSWNLNTLEPDADTGGSYTARASGNAATNAPERTRVCEACHDESPANIRLYDGQVTPVLTYSIANYTEQALSAASNYFGTRSGYARGGHGDASIQTENPFTNSDPSHNTAVDCTACHNASVGHTARVAADIHRLGWTTQTGQEIEDLCTNASCHGGGSFDYIQNHHASNNGNSRVGIGPVDPGTGTGALTYIGGTTSWTNVGGGYYEQRTGGSTSWGADTTTTLDTVLYRGNPDVYIDWWGTGGGSTFNANQATPPSPVFFGQAAGGAPRAILPLEKIIIGTGTSNKVLCTTCHNPHGTDLFTFDPVGNGEEIPDNNMLRLRDEDNTLCNACH